MSVCVCIGEKGGRNVLKGKHKKVDTGREKC